MFSDGEQLVDEKLYVFDAVHRREDRQRLPINAAHDVPERQGDIGAGWRVAWREAGDRGAATLMLQPGG